MSKSNWDNADWQRRFRAQPKVWLVVDDDDFVSVYESREAAELHLEWVGKHSKYHYRCYGVPVHSFELAQERWGE